MKVMNLHIQRKAIFTLCSVAIAMSIVNYTFASSRMNYNQEANSKSLLMEKYLRNTGDGNELKKIIYPEFIQPPQHAIVVETKDARIYSTPVITEKNINTIKEEKVVATKEDGVSSQVVNDFDISSAISCGNWKCFIPSLSDQDIGYLVMRDTNNSTIMNIGWTVAKEIEANYGAMHLYLEAPYTAELSPEIRMKLNKIVIFEAFDGFGEDFFQLSSVIVQKMKKSPQDALFFGCFGQNFDTFLRKANDFIWNLGESGKISSFLKTIKESYDIMNKVVTARPILLHDFQAIIDTEGHLFFIDLDGHVNWRPNHWSKDHPKSGAQCLGTLLDLRSGVQKCKNIMSTRAFKRRKKR